MYRAVNNGTLTWAADLDFRSSAWHLAMMMGQSVFNAHRSSVRPVLTSPSVASNAASREPARTSKWASQDLLLRYRQRAGGVWLDMLTMWDPRPDVL